MKSKISFLFAAMIAATAFLGSAFTPAPTVANVDVKSSVVTWKGYKVTGEHAGTVNVKSGKLEFNNGVLTGGSFEIDMNTIKTTDLQGEWAAKLDGHLKNDDFFGVTKYPTAKLVITKVVSKGKPGAYKVTGNLTIKAATKEIKFDTQLTEAGNQVTAESAIRLDRTDFDVKYGSGSFFDGLGDKTIYDEFDLNVKLVATK